MRTATRWIVVIAVLLAGWSAPLRLAQAAIRDITAGRVFGQPDFIHNDSNHGGLNAKSLSHPYSAAPDKQGNLYVADYNNNRVLEYDTPLSADTTADRVFGQPDFTHNANNNGLITPTATSLVFPTGVALDGQGRLYVADQNNSRVLEYDAPLTSDQAAARVFGQPDFTHKAGNNGSLTPSANSLNSPEGVALDAQNNLYVADTFNNRVLEYDAALLKDYLPLVVR